MMENHLKTTDGVPAQTDRTLATWQLMMQGYRKSYWKTVLTAGVATLMCTTLTTAWIAKGQIGGPGLILTRLQQPVSFWALVIAASCLAISGAAVVCGGVICLYREWRQYR